MILLRAYRAVDEEDTCKEFAEGHRKVLEGFNLGNITTNNLAWAYNSHVYVVIARDMNTQNLLGGIRIQIADGIHPLPVEGAVAHFDPKIIDMVKLYSERGGTSELCGLWTSREVAPNTGITINLVTAGMALCSQLPITSIFTIVASYTLKIALRMGYRIEKELGNNGEFIYPNSNFIARVLSMNPQTLENTSEPIRTKILSLREDPFNSFEETTSDNRSITYSCNLQL